MQVKRFQDAKPYKAPNHHDCGALRLFGAEAGICESMALGISHYLPGGQAGPDASAPEKVYVVLEGELTVIVEGQETVLKKYDSVYIAPNEMRTIVNRSNTICTILVAMQMLPK